MAKDKIPPHKVEMTEGKREIIKGLLSQNKRGCPPQDSPFYSNKSTI